MRIALLWNDSLIRDAMATYLEARGKFDVVIATEHAKGCLEAVKEHNVHVIVAELSHMDSSQRQFLLGARLLGSFGLLFVSKENEEDGPQSDQESQIPISASREEFFGRIRACGEPFNTMRDGRRSRADKPLGLSAREYEVATLIAKGYSNRRISEETGIQEQSVKNAVSTVLRKLNCENRTQLALKLLF